MERPSPHSEIRLVALRSLRGANFWSPGPVTRIDLATGVYDRISSADIPRFTESLVGALPGLVEHRCSVGERGGFMTRLRRGTFAPHILEHLALELQNAIGHDVGFGRARGGDEPGVDTVVFEHRHGRVGMRAAELALDMVRDAFDGRPAHAGEALGELMALADEPDDPPPHTVVSCAVTGGPLRASFVRELERRSTVKPKERMAVLAPVEVAPRAILETGLPYLRSKIAVITDLRAGDLPDRYREPGALRHLLAVVAETVTKDGWAVIPSDDPDLLAMVAQAGRRVALFGSFSGSTFDEATPTASVHRGRVLIHHAGMERLIEPHDESPLVVQAAAAITSALLTPPEFASDARRSGRYVSNS